MEAHLQLTVEELTQQLADSNKVIADLRRATAQQQQGT